MKPDLSRENCGYDSCPFIKGFWLRYTAEPEFKKVQKMMRLMYKSGERLCKHFPTKPKLTNKQVEWLVERIKKEG